MSALVTMVVLNTDIVGSTELRRRLGERAFQRVVATHDRILIDVAAGHRGILMKKTGDGTFFRFAAAADAVLAAVAMQRALSANVATGIIEEPIQIRIGVAVSDVSIDDDDEISGLAPVEATRLQAAAESGQVLCTATVGLLARGHIDVELEDIGDVEAKGLDPLPSFLVPWTSPQGSDLLPVPPQLDAVRRFDWVPRASLWATLEGAWADARRGRGCLIGLTGEPGAGKTRLCREFAQAVNHQGAAVLFGRCDEVVQYPYEPFIEALEWYLELVPPAERSLGDLASDLRRLSPDIDDLLADHPAPRSFDAETERYRLFEAIELWLAGVASDRGLLFVLDDLAFADPATLALLEHVAARIDEAPVMILSTYRPSEAQPASERLFSPAAAGHRRRVAVSGLDDEQVREFAQGFFDRPLSTAALELASRLGRRTQGNPLFLGEFLQQLISGGRFVLDDHGRMTVDRDDESLQLPEVVSEVVARRLSSLSDPTRTVLRIAAVVGPTFRGELVRQLAQVTPPDFVDCIDEAIGNHVVAESGEVGSFAFSHGLIRDAIYGTLSRTRRTYEHHRIGSWIEQEFEADLQSHAEQLAHHFGLSAERGDVDKAMTYSSLAGDRAARRHAYEAAAAHHRRALDLLPRTGRAGDDRLRLDITIALGTAARRAGQAEGRGHLLEAAREAARAGDGSRCARAVLAAGRGIFSSAGVIDDERVAAIREALELLPDDDDRVRAVLLANLGAELTFADDPCDPERASDEALAMARRLGDPRALIPAISLRLVALWRPDQVFERLRLGAELESMCDTWAADRPAVRLNALTGFHQAAMEAGELRTADRLLRSIETIATELRQPMALGYAQLKLANRATIAGDLERGERLAAEAYHYSRRAGQPDAEPFFVGQRFHVSMYRGDFADVHDDLVRMADAHPGVAAFRYAVAMMQVELGDLEGAKRSLDAATPFDHIRFDLNWLVALAFGASLSAALGDVERARHVRPMLEPYAAQYVDNSSTFWGSVEHFLGQLHRTLGEHDRAVALLSSALEKHRRLGLPGLIANTEVELARTLAAASAPDDARTAELLDDAFVRAEAGGFAAIAAAAARLRAGRSDSRR